MKSLTILVCILLFASTYCVIVNSFDPSLINRARPVDEAPAPSQWIGIDDFLKITQ